MNLLDGPIFLFIWTGFTLLMSLAIGAFFLWGVRSGQFADQDRARYLALDAEIDLPTPKGGGEWPEQDRRRSP